MTGKPALVTGAGGGIGRETAGALARMGATVVVSARDVAGAQPVVDEITGSGGRAEALALDVSSLADVRRAPRLFRARQMLAEKMRTGSAPEMVAVMEGA